MGPGILIQSFDRHHKRTTITSHILAKRVIRERVDDRRHHQLTHRTKGIIVCVNRNKSAIE